jgi:Amt family ammonium transporter
MKSKPVPFILLGIFAFYGIFVPLVADHTSDAYNFGDIAWMLVSTAFVLLMTPGLSFFYGGMVGKKNVISTMFQSFIATGLISVLWLVVGFGLAFGPSIGGFIGNPASSL